MVLLEEYYELHEAENVSRFWKALHIIFYACSAGFGIWCGFTLAILRIAFDNRCFLFAKISWDSHKETGELKFVQTESVYDDSVWSRDTICEFCQYTMVSSFIFATIWAAFFLMCGNGGKSATGLPQPWRIVLPAMIFNFMYFVLAFSAALQIHHGTNVFCEKSSNFIGLESFEKCAVLKIYEKKTAHDIWIRLEIVNTTSWITAASWFIAFLIPFMRILFVSDFNLYKISVYRVDDLSDQNEEVIRVVEYEGRHVRFKEKTESERQLHED